nr:TPA_asm: hypothetical protein HUJ06_015972 [Nelumbo nucifera]
MQQNNYVEAEDAYRRALMIAPDNNKMCNLGICLMKQGRIAEAKETLGRVRPAVADGPRGVDSHLKAFERAQQMLLDLESELMNKGVDRVEQSRLFDTYLGSSSIWQPQPCKEQQPTVLSLSSTTTNTTKLHLQDDFADENIDSNRVPNQAVPSHRSMKPVIPNSLNIDAPPFYSSKLVKEPTPGHFHDPLGSLKRTRSGNAAAATKENIWEPHLTKRTSFTAVEQPEQKSRRRSLCNEEAGDEWTELLPDSKDFEEAIIAAILGPSNEMPKTDGTNNPGICQRKIDKRLKVFQDITLSLSPRA